MITFSSKTKQTAPPFPTIPPELLLLPARELVHHDTHTAVTLHEAAAILAAGADCEKRALRPHVDIDAGDAWRLIAVSDMVIILEAGRRERGWLDAADCVEAGWSNDAVARLAPQALMLVGTGDLTDLPDFPRTAANRFTKPRRPACL